MKTRSIISAFAIAALIMAGVTVVSVAANGGPALLGKANSATKTTTIKTTGNGAALSLKSRSSKAALKVSNKVKIKKLNADLLDGFDGTSLQTRPTVFTAPQVTPAVSSVVYVVPIPDGEYLIEWQIAFTGSPNGVDCFVFRDAPAAVNDTIAAGSTLSSASTLIVLNSTGYVRKTPGSTINLLCSSGNTFTTLASQPIQIIVTRLDGSTQTTVSPAPKPGPAGRP